MKKVAKAILTLLGTLLALGAFAVLGVNLYIQSAAVQTRIQQALGHALRIPVKITGTSFMPWSGVKLAGIIARDPDSPTGDNVLEVAAVSARIRLSKLLARKVVIKELTIDGAKVSWNQTADGKWRLPEREKTAVEKIAVTSGTGTQAPPESPSQTEPPQPPRVVPPQVTVNHFRLRDAELTLLDNRHRRIAAITGLNVQAAAPAPESIHGVAWITRVTIREIFPLENWRTDFRCSPAELSLFNSRATFAGGTATGSLTVKTSEPDSPFDTEVKFSGVDLGRAISQAGVRMVEASGTLAGFLKLQGNLRDSNAAAGSGQIVVANGRLEHFEFFQNIGRALRADKFQRLDFDLAQLDYHVAGGKIFIDQLALKTPNLALACQGMMDRTGNLFLKSRLTLGAGLVKVIPPFLLENFAQGDTPGSRSIDFSIFGRTNSLKTDLHKRIGLVEKFEKGAHDIFKSLFGGREKTEPVPAATPEPPTGTTAPSAAP